MKILRFEAEGFRNMKELCFLPSPGINLIAGENGQGKTNLLEAIWLFTGMRSFRGAKDREMIGFDGQHAALSLSFQTEQREQRASLCFLRGNPVEKQASLNGVPLEHASKLFGALRAVVFSPEHLSLVKGGPEERRRFLDSALSQSRPSYLKLLRQYNRILSQRNALLKANVSREVLHATIEGWDAQLSKVGSYITLMRADYVEKLAEQAGSYYDGISSGREAFSMRYHSTIFCKRQEGVSYTNGIINYYYDRLQSHLGEDIRLGFTGCGVHRDDLRLTVAGKDARSFASQGQQRSAVLSLKLAECELLREASGDAPCVLLDDVMSELDHGRRMFLMEHLSDMQVFITGTEAMDIPLEGACFHVHDGVLSPG